MDIEKIRDTKDKIKEQDYSYKFKKNLRWVIMFVILAITGTVIYYVMTVGIYLLYKP